MHCIVTIYRSALCIFTISSALCIVTIIYNSVLLLYIVVHCVLCIVTIYSSALCTVVVHCVLLLYIVVCIVTIYRSALCIVTIILYRSGSSANLEMAVQLAGLDITPKNQVCIIYSKFLAYNYKDTVYHKNVFLNRVLVIIIIATGYFVYPLQFYIF